MYLKKILFFIVIFLIVLMFVSGRQKSSTANTILSKRMQIDGSQYSLLNVNNISAWIFCDGISGHSPYTDDHGIFYPRGTAGIVFQDGVIWGGFVNDPDTSRPALRVGGQTYISVTVHFIVVIWEWNTREPVNYRLLFMICQIAYLQEG